jgi:hypothetical protein
MYHHQQYLCPWRGLLLLSQCLAQKVWLSLIAQRDWFGATNLCQISHTEQQKQHKGLFNTKGGP